MIYLTLKDLEKIKTILEQANVDTIGLESDSSSGIGSILTVTYETRVADYPAKMVVEISGVEDW